MDSEGTKVFPGSTAFCVAHGPSVCVRSDTRPGGPQFPFLWGRGGGRLDADIPGLPRVATCSFSRVPLASLFLRLFSLTDLAHRIFFFLETIMEIA